MPFLITPLPEHRDKPEIHPSGTWLMNWHVMLFLLIGAGVSIGAYFMAKQKEFLIRKGDRVELAPWRKEKLERELEELDHAEQYALLAGRPGFYPCFPCQGKKEIFLTLGEVWKYGVTTKGETGRYRDGFPKPGLAYVIEFEGPLQECLKQEKLKIYRYATLPENLKRERPLIRPPGNKVDR